MYKLNPDERLLVLSGDHHYELLGPGLVVVLPWQQALTKLYLGPQGQSCELGEVRTVENVPVDITAQVNYQIDPGLFSDDLWSKIPELNQEEGWKKILKRRTEHILRQMLASYSWRKLNQPEIQSRLERQFEQILATCLKSIGLKIISVCLVKIELPGTLQNTILRAERDAIEPQGRLLVLRQYLDLFGPDMAQAMPYIIQWELLNMMHKKDGQQFLFTDSALTLNQKPRSSDGAAQALFPMRLPQSPYSQ
jgi:regulator of protease activity HflC (stomatin/prohibitin superfamily)